MKDNLTSSEPAVSDKPLFRNRKALVISGIFLLTCVVGNLVSSALAHVILPSGGIHAPWLWPLCTFGIFKPFSIYIYTGLSAVILMVLFIVAMKRFSKIVTDIRKIILLGIVLVLCSNLIPGIYYGLEIPTIHFPGYFSYYHDAVNISSVIDFLRSFNSSQRNMLALSSRTHPPGAVLSIYALFKAVGTPANISVAIAILSVCISGFFLYMILVKHFGETESKYVTLLFLMIPAVHIYYCATIDALIASVCLGAIYFWCHPKTFVSIVGSIACLFVMSFMTFGSLFIGPVLLGYDLIRRRNIYRSIIVFLGLGIIYGLLYIIYDFNYIRSFFVASSIENPRGFILLVKPLNYVSTRILCVCELIVYLGPFLLVLLFYGLRDMAKNKDCPDLFTLTILGIGTLLAMFLTGAYRTAETARTCLFIYPFLMLPVAYYLQYHHPTEKNRIELLGLVFAQTVIMQMMGCHIH